MPASQTVEKKYDALKKKFKLPSFQEMDSSFEISLIDAESISVREIRKRVGEKIVETIEMLERALQPDTCLSDLCESRVLNEADKKDLFTLYKKLMFSARENQELGLLNEDKKDLEFIKKFFAEWKAIRQQLLKYVRKLKDSWENETEDTEKAPYMG